MNFSKLNKIAWTIRKESAKKFNCKVSEISWKDCLKLAREKVQETAQIPVQKSEQTIVHCLVQTVETHFQGKLKYPDIFRELVGKYFPQDTIQSIVKDIEQWECTTTLQSMRSLFERCKVR